VFDIEEFIAECVAARSESNPIVAVKEVLDRALSTPDEIADALPATGAEFKLLHSSADLSILKFVWGPAMSIPPHDHLMWAVNGIYGGEEDNVFYRRTPDGLVESGGRRVGQAESAMLGADVIHAVTNPRARACTGSIHVYGGDYLRKRRSMWDPATLEERPADGETIRRLFEEAKTATVDLR
jgi:predicted metal-dependent enzyme (double-stranded beta helix superfamily)